MKTATKIVAMPLMALTLIVGGLGFAFTNSAQASLLPGGAVGSIAPDGGPGAGFPLWFQDQNSLKLDLMEAADAFSISDPIPLPLGTNPFAEQIGFNAEGFWWSAEAAKLQGGVDALLVLAMEAVFGGEAAVDGEQSAFGRLRIRIDGLTPNTQYTVRHPFGTNTFTSDGVGVINEPGLDIGCIATAGVTTCDPAKVGTGNPALVSAGDFSIALSSQIGPFLTWDTFNSNPLLTDPLLKNNQPAYANRIYVGNPAIEHAITGSPVGQNLFRIEGLNAGGAGVNFLEQTLFTVSGRLFSPVVTVNALTTNDSTPTFTGTVNDLTATISVTVNAQTFAGTNNGDGTWTATAPNPLADGTHDVVVSATPTSGGVGVDSTTNELILDATAPVLAEVTIVPATAPNNTPSYTFSTTEAGTITYGGSCASTTTNATVGNNTITFNKLAAGLRNDCTITVTDAMLNASIPLSITPFTVRPASNIAVYDGKGKWFLDFSGNGAWNGTPTDKAPSFGFAGTTPVSGDWDGNGTTEIAVYDGKGTWYLDIDGNGAWDGPVTDKTFSFGFAGTKSISGNWLGSTPALTSKIAVYDGKGTWYLDMNGNGAWDGPVTDKTFSFGFAGTTPVTGDWDGNGTTEIAVYDGKGTWYLDMNGNGAWDGAITDKTHSFGFAGTTPASGDWDGSGVSKIGVFDGINKWYLDINGNGAWNGVLTDKTYSFGFTGVIPAAGNWN